ncbi:hypothetical protein NE237_021900 [Protea cynaroides]|uniref:Uncharacterized protein n=1 Tax=Protea cynaroides TaxID=273540 RepID=A0A9Q0HC77_9MAGN|nr:hypothetical protein NE237_021900 [Protea cynaroides]
MRREEGEKEEEGKKERGRRRWEGDRKETGGRRREEGDGKETRRRREEGEGEGKKRLTRSPLQHRSSKISQQISPSLLQSCFIESHLERLPQVSPIKQPPE